jgi:hypothetical protein
MSSTVHKSRIAIGAAIVAALVGCMNSDPVSVQSTKGPALSASSANSQGRNPNSVKYRDTGVKPATGRSGSATLEVRALAAQDGSTLIEATTGSIEAGTSVGKIDKIQLKVLAGDTTTQNFNKLTNNGAWSKTLTSGISRGTKVQVQANVSGVDPKRTDVVTVTATVARRPDIQVVAVNGPAEIAPNTPVVFMATVSEINGDVGARANCVLKIDGAAAGEATGIWIDAGGTVTCQFTHTFTEVGTHSVVVSATNVNPGDWNLANNSASSSIEVRAPHTTGTIEHGQMQVAALDYTYRNEAANIDGRLYRYDNTQRIKYTYGYFYGYETGATPITAGFQTASMKVLVNGVTVASSNLTPTQSSSYDDGYWFSNCTYHDGFISSTSNGNDYAWYHTGNWMQACSQGYHGNPESVTNYYYFQKVAGEALYYGSSNYSDPYGYDYSNTWNQINRYDSGVPWTMHAGDQVEFQVGVTDGAGVEHTANRAAVLEDRSADLQYLYEGTYYDSYYGSNIWYRNSQTGTHFYGYTNF